MSKEKTLQYKIKRPIGAKLIIIITVLLLFSLGTITMLMSTLMSDDIQITAEDNNFTVNRRSASEADSYIDMITRNTLVYLTTLNMLEAVSMRMNTRDQAVGTAEDIFFERNPEIAYIGIVSAIKTADANTIDDIKTPSISIAGTDSAAANGNSFTIERSFVNEIFFLSNELESNIIDVFFDEQNEWLEQCLLAVAGNGEVLLANAAPVFDMPVLVLFFPWQDSQGSVTGIVFFSSNTLTEKFSDGTNLSYMVNNKGDYLIHADFELIRNGGFSESPLVARMIENNDDNRQTLYTENNGSRHFGAYKKIAIGNAWVVTTIPYDVVFEGITATTRRNLYLTAAVMFIAIVFIWFFSKTVSVPLKALSAAALQIEGGNFEFDIKPKTQDEVGFLTKSFERMTGALNVFGRFTNREIAVKAMRGEIKPGGLPKHATIFFSDIRGFTAKSENFTIKFGGDASDRIIHWLNIYFTGMIDCVEKTNGVVDKFIGDAVMAHWGTAYSAGSPEKDAYNGVLCALMMREVLLKMNEGRNESDPANPPITIGCGLNTGIVTAGQLGSDQRMEYTVIGDPVNLASRIEALNKPMGTDILISEYTLNLLGDQFITEEMPSVTVKGKAKPLRIFAVVNLKGAEGPKTLAQVRKLLGIKKPENIDTNAEEKKYKIGGAKDKDTAKEKTKKTGRSK